jgi:hypothetical protein
MKNIHVIPTDKPSRLVIDTIENKLYLQPILHEKTINVLTQNIYITSDEEAEEGDWVIYRNSVFKIERGDDVLFDLINVDFRKVILTTDQDLIKEGVQAIDDEFLEWFVKNPSCEYIQTTELSLFNGDTGESGHYKYEIIIPQEEPKFISGQPFLEKADEVIVIHRPKQETVEEVRKVKRTELFKSILSIVKQIPRKDVEGDAMDAPSCAYEIEQLFYKLQSERLFTDDEMNLAYILGGKGDIVRLGKILDSKQQEK